ncbi:MAG: tetratricopeptide repeat protein [Proteobacteria bacterium]|nr:tetratricopeptide repeat protein [Pseudomonadota bacterium]
MPFIGIGLHILVALFFAVHAVRTGRDMYWLLILFMFPLLGSVVYLFAVYLPDSRLQHGARRAIASAAKALDPTRELRDARAAFDYTPTAQNQMRLAAALLNAGQPEEAATSYEACLSGPFANDPEIRFGAAQANVESQNFERAIEQLELIRKAQPEFRAEQVSLLLARALSQSGHHMEAKAEFESAIAKFGSFDAKAEYLVWALISNERELAARLQVEVQRTTERWNRQTRELNLPMLRRLEAAYEHARQRR